MNLCQSSKSKIIKYKNAENMPQLGINEVILLHFNIVNNDYKQNSWDICSW